MQFYTYIYRDPTIMLENYEEQPFYVGKGCGERYKITNRRNNHVQTRIRKLQNSNIEPIVELFNTTNELAAHWLERCFISAYGRKDTKTGPLFNHTNGGEGLSGLVFTDTHRANISKANLISQNKLETKLKKSAIAKIVMNSPEVQRKISGENSHMKRPEMRELVRKNRLGKPSPFSNPEVQAKIRAKRNISGDNNPMKRPEVKIKAITTRNAKRGNF